MYKLALLMRYLRRPVGLFPILAAGLGTYALIVVLAVMSGFGNYVKDKIRGTLSDVVVRANDARGTSGHAKLTRSIEAIPGVAGVSPHLSGKALMTVYATSDAGRPLVIPVVFIGIDLARERQIGSLGKSLTTGVRDFSDGVMGDVKLPGIICGGEMFWPLMQGIRVSLTAPTVREGDVAMSFRVVDYFRSGLSDFDRCTVYIPLEAAQKLTETPDAVTGFQVAVAEGHQPQIVIQRISETLSAGDFTVKTWAESRKALLAAIAMERIVWTVVLGSMLLVAGFAIMSVLALLVIQKRRDIGIIRSIGGGVGGIATVFVGYGVSLGLIGASIGLALGYLTVRHIGVIESVVLKYTGYTPWPRTVFYFDSIPCECSSGYMLTFFAIAVLISLLASIYPALRAAKLDPIQTLRWE
ncbi:MAG: FtsX-like permease family protein [Candidatus Cloacimonetes bacterium]|nr:FtsX-like permease family protein [Candidatus Cloacimonadota bacterium]